MTSSAKVTFSYSIKAQTVAPKANPVSGTIVASGGKIKLSTTTSGATIYYTTNGSTPTASSTSGTDVTLPSGSPGTVVTVKAITVKAGMNNSSVSTFTYTIRAQVIAPSAQATVTDGKITRYSLIKLLASTPGATIYYTTNGSEPTTSSSRYNLPYWVTGPKNSTLTIKAIAVKSGMANSTVFTITYTIK
ncbi:hypothetical protein EHS13_24970 [Paenibacillus psychroresistens]|uniref:GH29D-like beta-sandwich domain-containing protein n=1 Tax=Paenibacillus psychroresistens TaxID=1778678 RepID=A0A6B8RPY6_9BACL|nr:chitobiase/beta-hexosaminidase C-terminal domain-containing protein [Paenibacillus psychroresistens]QGQ97907.1 hypothetical protein EHS13_24970 [Paenibacillus psychroresistens]